MAGVLGGMRVVVPESRELDLFVSMLERAGATAIRCPLVTILDLEDDGPALAWLHRLVAGGMDDLVLYTGEGLRRLLAVAERAGIADDVKAAVGRVRTIVRGPKPARVLREIGLAPGLSAPEPTTDGLLDLLSALPMEGRRVGIQLYPKGPDTVGRRLEDMGARVDPVLPYRYSSDREAGEVADTIRRMAAGEVDVMALTSRPQVVRLVEVAREAGIGPLLDEATRRVRVAAVGPITAEAARAAGWEVSAMPDSNFHLKPFIAELATLARGRAEPVHAG